MFFILGKDLADSGGCKAGYVGVKTAAKRQLATAGVQAWDGLELEAVSMLVVVTRLLQGTRLSWEMRFSLEHVWSRI